jgi:hypothetical protein
MMANQPSRLAGAMPVFVCSRSRERGNLEVLTHSSRTCASSSDCLVTKTRDVPETHSSIYKE